MCCIVVVADATTRPVHHREHRRSLDQLATAVTVNRPKSQCTYFRETSFWEASFRESDFPGNDCKPIGGFKHRLCTRVKSSTFSHFHGNVSWRAHLAAIVDVIQVVIGQVIHGWSSLYSVAGVPVTGAKALNAIMRVVCRMQWPVTHVSGHISHCHTSMAGCYQLTKVSDILIGLVKHVAIIADSHDGSIRPMSTLLLPTARRSVECVCVCHRL